uniref:Uncharacterized protein n=1 Tax=Ananas comosus var. bracteatus TaxID=296719 RepID=A0A6V7Q1L6_ANACO|nr:unnamed protein product [Ananas comosus var. bracteatus]
MSMKMAPMDNAIIHGPREEGHPLLMVSMSVEMDSMDHVTVYGPRSMVQHDLMAVKVIVVAEAVNVMAVETKAETAAAAATAKESMGNDSGDRGGGESNSKSHPLRDQY